MTKRKRGFWYKARRTFSNLMLGLSYTFIICPVGYLVVSVIGSVFALFSGRKPWKVSYEMLDNLDLANPVENLRDLWKITVSLWRK